MQQIGYDIGHSHGVDQVRLSRQPFLALMHLGRKIVGLANQFSIRGRIIRLDFLNQFVDFDLFAHDYDDPAVRRNGSIRHFLTREVLARSASTMDLSSSSDSLTSRLTTK